MTSIRDVAKKAGVSPTTVSRTFRTPDLLTQQTQHRVLDAARQLGYLPRPIRLHTPKRKRSARLPAGAIGFQFIANYPKEELISNTFYAPMLAGAQAEANALGLHLLIHTTDQQTLSQKLPRMVEERAIEGMLLVGMASHTDMDLFAKYVPHIVLVDNHDDRGLFECVLSDGFGGGLAATKYLLDLGHRHILFFQPREGVATFRDRKRGYWSALLEAGIVPDLNLVIEPHTREEEWGDALKARLLNCMTGKNRPTALLAANDDSALFAQRICREKGIRVPDDFSLIGFDDMPFAAHADPLLTTVRVDKEAMGRLAVRRLHARIQAAGDNKGLSLLTVQHTVPVSLIVRESCVASH